jgi:hypothetical protein
MNPRNLFSELKRRSATVAEPGGREVVTARRRLISEPSFFRTHEFWLPLAQKTFMID